MVPLGKTVLVFLLITSVFFSQEAPLACPNGQFLDSYLFSTFDQTNHKVDISFLYSQIQNGVETRSPVAFASVYAQIEEKDKLPRFVRIVTNEQGKASLDVSSMQGCGRISFVYPSGIDSVNEFKSVGIDLNAFGINDLSAVPCFDAQSCQQGVQNPASLRSAFSRSDVCVAQAQTAPVTPAFCLPLVVIFALLGGAMYLSGRNPLSLFDFSSPRMGKLHQYSGRTRSISFDSSSMATGAIKLGRTAADAKGVAKEEKGRESFIKERTGIKNGFIAMTVGQGILAPLTDKQVGLRSGFSSLKGRDVSKRTAQKAKQDTPALKSQAEKNKEKPEVDTSHFGFTPERMQKLGMIAQRDPGLAGLLYSVTSAPRGQKLDALNESLLRGASFSPILYAISVDSVTKLTRTVGDKEALELVAGGALAKGKSYEFKGKTYTLKTKLNEAGSFALVLVDGKGEKPATDKSVPESVRREALLDIVEKVALGANSLRSNSGDFQSKQDEAREKISSLLENPKIAEAAVNALFAQASSARTAPERQQFGSYLGTEAGSLIDQKTGKPVDTDTRNTILRDSDARERLADAFVQNPSLLNRIILDKSEGSLMSQLNNGAKQELVFSAAIATAAYSKQIEYSAVSRIADDSTALLTRMDTDKSYVPSSRLVNSIGEAGVQATASNIKATAALDGFEKSLAEFNKNPGASGAVAKLAEATQGLSVTFNDKLANDLKFQMAYRLAQYDQIGTSISLLDGYNHAYKSLESDIAALKESKTSLESAQKSATGDDRAELSKQLSAYDDRIASLEQYKSTLPQEEQAALLAMLSALPKQDGKISEADAKYYGAVIGALEVINDKYTYSSPEAAPNSLYRINELKEVADFRNAQAALEARKDEAKDAKDTDALADINRQIQELNEQYGFRGKNLAASLESEIKRVSSAGWEAKKDDLALETPYLLNPNDDPTQATKSLAALAKSGNMPQDVKTAFAVAIASVSEDVQLKEIYSSYKELREKLESTDPVNKDSSAQVKEDLNHVIEGIQKEVFARPNKIITDDAVEDLVSRQEALSKREKLIYQERPSYNTPPGEEYLASQFAQGAGGLSQADITNLLKQRAAKPQ